MSYFGESTSANAALAPEPPRSMGGIRTAVERLSDLARQLDRMVDRTVPTQPENCSTGIADSMGRRPYVVSLDELHREIDRVGGLVNQLEAHI